MLAKPSYKPIINSLVLTVPGIGRWAGAETIGWLRRRRWRGGGESNRRRVRRYLAQFSGRDCRQHVRGDHVLDAAQALVAPDRAGGLVRSRALRRMPRLPRILPAPASRSPRPKVPRYWKCPRCYRLNWRRIAKCPWCGHQRPALPDSHLCADRASRGALTENSSPARFADRAGIHSARCGFVRSALAREALAPPFAARRSTRNPHRADTPITRPPGVAIGNRRNAGRAGSVQAATPPLVH